MSELSLKEQDERRIRNILSEMDVFPYISEKNNNLRPLYFAYLASPFSYLEPELHLAPPPSETRLSSLVGERLLEHFPVKLAESLRVELPEINAFTVLNELKKAEPSLASPDNPYSELPAPIGVNEFAESFVARLRQFFVYGMEVSLQDTSVDMLNVLRTLIEYTMSNYYVAALDDMVMQPVDWWGETLGEHLEALYSVVAVYGPL